MRQYTREEVLDGDNAYFCERCQMKQRTLKRLTFSSLPPVICLQLKRFSFDWESQVAVKSNQAFSFPRRLDMAAFMGVGGSGVTVSLAGRQVLYACLLPPVSHFYEPLIQIGLNGRFMKYF